MFFVAGITGQVGGATARTLLEQGFGVRALVRDPRKAVDWAARGVEVRCGDLTDSKAVAAALAGVEGAFLMQPTPTGVTRDFVLAHALTDSIVAALRDTPPPRLAVLSSVGSERASGLGNVTQTHLFEEALKAFSFPIAVVRAGSLLENYLFSATRAGETGVFESFLQPVDRGFPMTATKDVGAEIARLLIQGWAGRRIVEVGSHYSPDDLARAMATVLGKPVVASAIPRHAWGAVLAHMGLSPEQAANWEEMQDGFNLGWLDFGVAGTESVPGSTTPKAVFAQEPRE